MLEAIDMDYKKIISNLNKFTGAKSRRKANIPHEFYILLFNKLFSIQTIYIN